MFVCPECGLAQAQGGACPADGTALAALDDPIVGTTVGVYRIARLLGVGGMGRVYKGVHPQIGSRVAIKVLSRECTDRKDLVERFFAEAKAVNLIRHESIVNVLDLSVLPDGRPYIIMEYLDGAPLASIIDHGVQNQAPLPLGGIARLTAEVLDALGAAHATGIIPRDLKPDNVFVAPSGSTPASSTWTIPGCRIRAIVCASMRKRCPTCSVCTRWACRSFSATIRPMTICSAS